MSQAPCLLFLNPPGRHVYLRDYFCSKISQADYINHPIDFVFLSGLLKTAYDLHLIDAIVEELDDRDCLVQIKKFQPQVVVGLIGSVSFSEDVAFYERLKSELDVRLILIGDILREPRRQRLHELSFAEAFLHDFSGRDLLKYLHGDNDLRNMTVRRGGQVFAYPMEPARGGALELPAPEHQLFLDKNYRYPFVKRQPFATLMTSYGCPYCCTFCVMPTLGWEVRPVENVLQELEVLGSLGIQELFFLDQTFGIPRQRAFRLLKKMERFRYRFGWVCFTRPDLLHDELLLQMKAAGGHTIILGLESGSQEILDAVRKDYRKDEVKSGFHRCAKLGIRTVATVLLGLPEETVETFRKTMAFLKQVNPDLASFNVAVPRMGTPIRKEAIELGLIPRDFDRMDQSGSEIAMPSLTLNREQIAALRRKAVAEFYFRPGYLARQLWKCSRSFSLPELHIQLRQGYHLLRNHLFGH